MKRIFILGCHRSGTTLMRLVLNSHSKIHCFDEWKSYKALENNSFENQKNAQILGFKTPNWTEYIVDSETYRPYYREQDCVLFMIRDVRACIASMLTLQTGPDGKKRWFDGAVNSITKKWPNDPHRLKFQAKHKEELVSFESKPLPEFRKAALFWKYKSSRYIEMAKQGWKVLPVFYEKLVHKPKDCLEIITDFLEVPWENNLLQHHQIEHDEVFNKVAVGNTSVERAIDTSSVIKWKNVITEEQEKVILEVAGNINSYFYNT